MKKFTSILINRSRWIPMCERPKLINYDDICRFVKCITNIILIKNAYIDLLLLLLLDDCGVIQKSMSVQQRSYSASEVFMAAEQKMIPLSHTEIVKKCMLEVADTMFAEKGKKDFHICRTINSIIK